MMDTLVPVDVCPHPELLRWDDMARKEQVYQCAACRKQIAIPHRTLIMQPHEGLVGIIQMTFGGRWATQALAVLES